MLVASATAYAWFVRTQIRAVFQEKTALQARGIAFLLTQEVMKALKLLSKKSDSLHDPWFQPMFIPLQDFGVANVSLKPLDNKIPLKYLFASKNNRNSDIDTGLKIVWPNMWLELGERGISLPAKVLDYIDVDTVPRAGGRDGPDNLNRDLFDISELLGIPEITPELLYGEPPTKRGLADYCTLWSGKQININTVEPHVLALFENMNWNTVEDVMKYRAEKEITNIADLKREIPSFPNLQNTMFIIGYTSDYYNLKIQLLDENWNSTRYFDIVLLKSEGRILRWEEM